MEEENLKVPNEYKKAYNYADMICSYMPHLLKSIQMPDKDQSEFTKGFQDRVKQYEIEQDAIKNFSVHKLKEKYSKELGKHDKDRNKDRFKG